MSKRVPQHAASLAVLTAAMLVMQGCGFADEYLKTSRFRFLDPRSVVVTPQRTPIAPILPSASPADPTEEILPNAEFPQENDYVYSAADYVIGPNDVIDVGILDLFQPGLETSVRRQVEVSGYIDLPLLTDRILAGGFTANELKQRIADAYGQTLLRDPNVSVSVVVQRQSTFSILGTVFNPGTYEISRRDMRLLDALALARGVTNPSIRYIYIIRPTAALVETEQFDTSAIPTARDDLTAPDEQPGPDALPEVPTRLPDLPEIAPPADDSAPDAPTRLPALPGTGEPPPAPDAPDEQDDGDDTEDDNPTPGLMAYVDNFYTRRAPRMALQSGQWVYLADQWVYEESAFAQVGASLGRMSETQTPGLQSTASEAQSDLADPWDWGQATKSDMARVIAINLEKLLHGDPRMNIVIRDNDIIYVPTEEIGEFYVMGEVFRPGVYSLTGRRITIKMAVAAAGNLSPVAWPEHSVLIRRIGENQEQIIPINIEKIFRGEESDIFLKPNDVIAVGTSAAAPFMAVIRNAFRMTYGFGFIYDRNFADPLPRGLSHDRFTHW